MLKLTLGEQVLAKFKNGRTVAATSMTVPEIKKANEYVSKGVLGTKNGYYYMTIKDAATKQREEHIREEWEFYNSFYLL